MQEVIDDFFAKSYKFKMQGKDEESKEMAAPPRLFKLLEEHEGALHGDLPPGITLGVADPKT